MGTLEQQQQLESERERNEEESAKPKRHNWMIELPDTGVSESVAFLQKPRQFNQSKSTGTKLY